MCRRKCECNLLGLCFQREKPGCDLANCRHQPLKSGYCARVPGALARLPIASPRSLLSTAPTKRVSRARHGWKPGGFEGARSSGRWRVGWSCRCAQQKLCPDTHDEERTDGEGETRGCCCRAFSIWFGLLGKLIPAFLAQLIRPGEMALSTHGAPAARARRGRQKAA